MTGVPPRVDGPRSWNAAAIGLLTLLQLGLVWWSWGRWLDPLVDFGRELYLPWQITEGRVLYRDLASFNGPLSPYLNALWFTIGGPSLRTLAIANTGIALLLAWLLFALLGRFASAAAALTVAGVFVLAFSVSHTLPIGNYNFITPYSHELTHGLVLSVLALWLIAKFAEGSRWALGAAGFAAGAILLTKVEVAAAAWLGLVVTLATRHRLQSMPAHAAVREWLIFAVAAAVAVGAAMLLFARVLPIEDALRAPLTHWGLVLRPGVSPALAALPFYRAIAGTHDWIGSATAIAIWSAAYGALFAAAVALSRLTDRRGRPVFPAEAIFIAAAAAAIALGLFVDDRPARPLPVLTVVLLVLFFQGIFVHRRGGMGAALHLGWIVFSAALLARLGLNPRLSHYGFALAMPAMLGAIVFLLDWLPRRLRDARSARAVRAAALAVLGVIVLSTLWQTARQFDRKTVPVGRGADAFLADERGHAIEAVLKAIDRLPSGRTLLVLPEGVMINYLSRTPSTIPYPNFMPPELILFDEAAIVDALERTPPSHVAIAHKDTAEYGFRFFGRDYGRALMAWVERHYHRVDLFGAEPLRDEKFGIALFEEN